MCNNVENITSLSYAVLNHTVLFMFGFIIWGIIFSTREIEPIFIFAVTLLH